MEKSCRIEGIRMGRDGPRGYCWKKASHRQIFIVGFLQNCGEKEPARSTVFDWVRSWLSVSGVTTPRENGSEQRAGSCHGNGSDV
jgi:hypothetical protein